MEKLRRNCYATTKSRAGHASRVMVQKQAGIRVVGVASSLLEKTGFTP